jgi:putative FmdB family regulatory protein
MPIYAYKCDACGLQKEVLQKMSDPLLTDCPSCGQASFKKQLTAAGFQLKGTGWYVTDFREGAGKSTAPAVEARSDVVDSTAKTAATTSTNDSKLSDASSTTAVAATSTVATTVTPAPKATPVAAPSARA